MLIVGAAATDVTENGYVTFWNLDGDKLGQVLHALDTSFDRRCVLTCCTHSVHPLIGDVSSGAARTQYIL
eukprot:scaffold16421_cov23-Tisochrysis_lutea.AAC.2